MGELEAWRRKSSDSGDTFERVGLSGYDAGAPSQTDLRLAIGRGMGFGVDFGQADHFAIEARITCKDFVYRRPRRRISAMRRTGIGVPRTTGVPPMISGSETTRALAFS